MRESLPPPAIPAEFLAEGGTSPLRLVSAIVLLALSLAIGYRNDRDPPPSEALPQPVRESVVAAVELAPLDPPLGHALLPTSSDWPAASPAPPKAVRHAEPSRAGERRQVARAADRRSANPVARPRGHHVARAERSLRASRQDTRTRAQVRAEYLRNREVVAALTGEDSGSAYFMRMAARQRAARPAGAGHRRG